MKQVAVFNRKIQNFASGNIGHDSVIQEFKLNNNPITCGMISCKDTYFNPSEDKNKYKVLVKKKAFSCNYRDKAITVHAQKRIDSYAAFSQAKFDTLGSEFTGEVVSVGDAVPNLRIGDHVIGNGNYPHSEYEGVIPGLPTNHGSKSLEAFHFSKLLKIPSSMPSTVAAGFPIGGQTVFSMIRRLELKPNDKVLITAATSNTSLFAISALRNCGIPLVIGALTTRGEFADRLKELGADYVFTVKKGQFPLKNQEDIGAFVKEHKLFDAVIDPFFDLYLGQTVELLSLHGKYITCGMYDQSYIGVEEVIKEHASDLNFIMQTIMFRNIQLIGNCIGTTADLEKAIEAYQEGKLKVVVDSVFGLGQEAGFFDRSFNSSNRFGKVVYLYD